MLLSTKRPYQFAVCGFISADYAIIVRPEDPGRDRDLRLIYAPMICDAPRVVGHQAVIVYRETQTERLHQNTTSTPHINHST